MTSSYVPPPPQPKIGHQVEDNSGDDAWELAETFVAGWRLFIILPLSLAIVAWAATWLVSPEFTAATTFVTVSRDQMPNLGGFASVASQLGVGLPSSPSSSPQFYADVLRSREVVEDVLRAKIPAEPVGASRDSIRILDLYEDSEKPDSIRLDRGVTSLIRESAVSVNPRTSVIELRVTSHSRTGSALVAKQFLSVLNSFNLNRRQSQAGARRRFLAARLREAQDSLNATELALQAFLEGNRQFRSAPGLQARFDRLQRQINGYQEVYSNFRQEFNAARVDEVNDTPVINVIDTAAVPMHKSSPRRIITAIVGGLLGLFLTVVYLLAKASMRRMQERKPGDYERLVRLRGIFLRTLGMRRNA
jgi:Uncharacterized protein involved in exopolysaccharide biosynthesis